MRAAFWTPLLLLLLLLTDAQSYKILGIFSHAGKSHFDVFQPLLKTLAAKGHDLTVISYFPQKNPLPNYKDISIKDKDVLLNVIPLILNHTRVEKYFQPWFLSYFAKDSCANLNHPALKKFLEKKERYDVVLYETFIADCFLGLVHAMKSPTIAVSSCTLPPWQNTIQAMSNNPSYIPVMFLDYSSSMTFLQRLENAVYSVAADIMYYFLFQRPQYAVAKKHFGESLPKFDEIKANSSLVLMNTHFSLNIPRPLPPNVIEIAGMHLRKPGKLSKDIETFINDSAHGVIYFSMGSMIKGHTFPPEKMRAFLDAFSKLPQRVLWKWENDTMPDKPANVMIKKWMPQLEILCHPNVKAFVSHSGLLSTTEAVHCGVPMVMMPQFGDQHTNAAAIKANGGGVILNFRDITEDTVSQALTAVLDPQFYQKAKDLSDTFNDRPMPPMDTAVYWVEYVARHRGAPRMRTAAVGMPLYQYLLLDVIGFLMAVIAVFVLAIRFAVKRIVRRYRQQYKFKLS